LQIFASADPRIDWVGDRRRHAPGLGALGAGLLWRVGFLLGRTSRKAAARSGHDASKSLYCETPVAKAAEAAAKSAELEE
jgi:hypothetical protein